MDKSADAWTTERLRVSKAEHEEWVSARLGAGQITIQPVDNSAFLESRRYAWSTSAHSEVAIVVSLTPLRALTEALDPLDALVVKQLASARIPDADRVGTEVHRSRTRPTATGVVNQDARGDNGYGHRIEIFRVGHCEYFLELGGSVRQITEVAKEKNGQLHDAQVIRYTDVAEGVELGLTWLWNVWTAILPYTYMSLTVRLINTANTVLYSREGSSSGALFGFTATDDHLEYSDVVQTGTDVNAVLLSALGRVVNAFGLVLTRVHDETGTYVRPERMR